MRIDRLGDKVTPLEKNQMLKIDELQEKIKLLEFDKSQDNAKIIILKRKLQRKKQSINTVIQELEMMKKEDNYFRIGFVISNLKQMIKEDENDKYEI